jgi:hypothetical protein
MRVLLNLLIWVLPLAFATLMILAWSRHGVFGVDFRENVWRPALDEIALGSVLMLVTALATVRRRRAVTRTSPLVEWAN